MGITIYSLLWVLQVKISSAVVTTMGPHDLRGNKVPRDYDLGHIPELRGIGLSGYYLGTKVLLGNPC